MSLTSDYIARRMSAKDLEDELLSLIKRYNDYRKTFLLVLSSAVGKPIPDIALTQEDFYIVSDILSGVSDPSKVDIYLETPGGSDTTPLSVQVIKTVFGCFGCCF